MIKQLRKIPENTTKLSVTDDNKHIQKREGGGWAVIIHLNSATKLFHFLEFTTFK